MMIELKLQAAASVTPVRAMGCIRAKQCEAALSPKPRARKAQAEGHELHAPSSVRRPHTACAAQAEGKNSGKGDEQAEAAGGRASGPSGR